MKNNKIIIKPEYQSKEEYQELKNYLTRKGWDWQEISSGNPKNSGGDLRLAYGI